MAIIIVLKNDYEEYYKTDLLYGEKTFKLQTVRKFIMNI